MEPTDFSHRLARALDEREVTQAGLAQHAGVTPSTVSHWVTGRREPDLDTINAVAGFLRVTPAWLAFGEGPMCSEAEPPAATAEGATATQIDGTPSHGRKPATRGSRGSRLAELERERREREGADR